MKIAINKSTFLSFLEIINVRSRSLLIIIFLYTILYPTFAQSDAIDDGVAWLSVNQNASGSWGNPDKSEFRDTTVVLNVLKKLGETGSSFNNGVSFINGVNTANNDYLARKAKVLARDGEDISTLIDDLIATQNAKEINNTYHNYPEGGWGIADDYSTNCLDTSLVLDTLRYAPIPKGLLVIEKSISAGESQDFYYDYPTDASDVEISITDISGNIEFRLFPDDSSGYYGFGPLTIPTYLNLGTIVISPGRRHIQISGNEASTYSFQITFNSASYNSGAFVNSLAYLVEAQNGDGGWGLSRGDDSNIFITAKVLVTLENFTDYDFGNALSSGVLWLISQRNPDNGFGMGEVPHMKQR